MCLLVRTLNDKKQNAKSSEKRSIKTRQDLKCKLAHSQSESTVWQAIPTLSKIRVAGLRCLLAEAAALTHSGGAAAIQSAIATGTAEAEAAAEKGGLNFYVDVFIHRCIIIAFQL